MRVMNLADPLPMAVPGTESGEKPRNIFGLGQESPAFKIGDRVQITEYPSHDPYHWMRGATVVKIDSGPAYGLRIDGMESMGTHKWYVGSELGKGSDVRSVGRVMVIPDVIMTVLGAAGVIGSLYLKHETAKMVVLMLGSMSAAVGLHGALMRVIENQVGAELNCPPSQ